MQTFTFSVDRVWGFTPPSTPESEPAQPENIHTLVEKSEPFAPFVVRSIIYRSTRNTVDLQLDEFYDRMNLPTDERSTVALDFVFPDLSRSRRGKDFDDYPLNPLMVATARQRRFDRQHDGSLVTAQINFSGMGYAMPHLPDNAADAAVYAFNLHPMNGYFDPSGQRIGKIQVEA